MGDPRARPPEKVLDSGYFDGPTFADLLGVLYRKRVTGTLHVTGGNTQRSIHFQQGNPRQVSGGGTSSIEAAVREIFGWFGGTFRLVETPGPSEGGPPSPNVLALIYAGSASFSVDQLRGIAHRLDGVVLPRSAPRRVPAGLALGPAEKRLLTTIDGKRSIGSLLRTADLGSVRLLHALHCTEQPPAAGALGETAALPPPGAPPDLDGSDREPPRAKLDLADTARLLAAEGKFHRARALIERNDFRAAHAELLEATRLDADEGDYRAYLGWAHFRLSPRDPRAMEQSLGELAKALELNPRNDKAYLFRGYIRAATGDLPQARSDFERALQCNGDSREALNALLRMNERVA